MVCPECGHKELSEHSVTNIFPYGPDDTVRLRASVPVMTCQRCSFMWTDHRAEDAKEAAIKKYLADKAIYRLECTTIDGDGRGLTTFGNIGDMWDRLGTVVEQLFLNRPDTSMEITTASWGVDSVFRAVVSPAIAKHKEE